MLTSGATNWIPSERTRHEHPRVAAQELEVQVRPKSLHSSRITTITLGRGKRLQGALSPAPAEHSNSATHTPSVSLSCSRPGGCSSRRRDRENIGAKAANGHPQLRVSSQSIGCGPRKRGPESIADECFDHGIPLECQSNAELQLPRRAACAGSHDLTESDIAQHRNRGCQIGVIENIEGACFEIQLQALL